MQIFYDHGDIMRVINHVHKMQHDQFELQLQLLEAINRLTGSASPELAAAIEQSKIKHDALKKALDDANAPGNPDNLPY